MPRRTEEDSVLFLLVLDKSGSKYSDCSGSGSGSGSDSYHSSSGSSSRGEGDGGGIAVGKGSEGRRDSGRISSSLSIRSLIVSWYR